MLNGISTVGTVRRTVHIYLYLYHILLRAENQLDFVTTTSVCNCVASTVRQYDTVQKNQ